MWTSQKVSAAGLNTPVTVFAKNPKNIPFLINQVGELPCVLKTPYGSQGTGVIKMVDYQQTMATIELCNSKEIDTLLQRYIPAGGKDYRVIVVGDKVVCTMLRIAKDGFKANISQGGEGKKVELSEEHQEFCVQASRAIGLKFSGVDIMISNEDGKAYLVEINSNPGTKSIDVCNHNWFVDWVQLIEREFEKHERLRNTDFAMLKGDEKFEALVNLVSPAPESSLLNTDGKIVQFSEIMNEKSLKEAKK
jgi:ribosomal protein S6--L-glutamate ligase